MVMQIQTGSLRGVDFKRAVQMVYMPMWVSKVGRTQHMLSFVDVKGVTNEIGPVIHDALYLLLDKHQKTIKNPNDMFPGGHKKWNAEGWAWAKPDWVCRYKPNDQKTRMWSPP